MRRFRLPRGPILRDADGIEVLGGVSSEITPLLRGRLGLGYIYADFKDPNIESRGAPLGVRRQASTPATAV
ncbi:MAG: hypothetical protein EOP49_28790, partial [Sphingobacteriales bacterium]